jgi:hypothetical protein
MRLISIVVSVIMAIGITGCELSKPYVTKVDRTDQVVDSANRGYLKGTPPPVGDRGELKRPFMTVDIDLPSIQGKPTKETQVVGAAKEETAANIRHEKTVKEEQVK